jgi:hypothetical protein
VDVAAAMVLQLLEFQSPIVCLEISMQGHAPPQIDRFAHNGGW